MSKQLRELQARKAALVKDARTLDRYAPQPRTRDMDDEEELTAFDALKRQRIEAASRRLLTARLPWSLKRPTWP